MNDLSQPVPQITREHYLLPDVRCANCCLSIEGRLSEMQGVGDLTVNYAEKRLTFSSVSTMVTDEVLAAIAAMGYEVLPDTEGDKLDLYQRDRRHMLARLGVAGIGMMQVMMFALAGYVAGDAGIEPAFESLMRWASLAIAVPVTFYSALPFHRGAWRDLRNHVAGMDVPVSIAILAAFGLSSFNTVMQSGDVYFDSACMFTFFLLTGRFLEMSARQHFQIDHSLGEHLLPTTARLAQGNVLIPVAQITEGQHIRVLPGERVPADGVVCEGASSVDESSFTGESRPLVKRTGARVLAGTINLDGELVISAASAQSEWVITHLSELYRAAAGFKPPFAVMADRVARYFVAGVLLLSFGAGLYWWQAGSADFFAIALAVMVVSCPCALSLATPVAYVIATGAVQKRGVLIASGSFLERLATVDAVILDKTGTLTEGDLKLNAIEIFDDNYDEARLRSITVTLEGESLHPVACTLRQDGADLCDVSDLKTDPGSGVSGVIDSVHYRFGKPDFSVPGYAAQERPYDQHVLLSADEQPIASFFFTDRVRESAAPMIAALQAQLATVTVFSGDNSQSGEHLLAGVGIDSPRMGMSADEKMSALQTLQETGRTVMMIGDGINDAGAMAVADVSLAVNPVDSIVQSAADATLVNGDLEAIPTLFTYAKRVRGLIRQNMTWAIAYNLMVIPLAVGGLLAPWGAALGMSLSSLLVTLNACRLGRLD